jgi:hypothetical protein
MVFDPAMAPFASYYLNPFKAAAASFGVEAIVAPVHDSRCPSHCLSEKNCRDRDEVNTALLQYCAATAFEMICSSDPTPATARTNTAKCPQLPAK